jgi:hypothetical protein
VLPYTYCNANNNRASDLYRLMKRRSYNPFGHQDKILN